MVRHRIASYAQRSQRYCSEDGSGYVTPKKELYNIVEQLRKVLGKEILVLPKNFDILLNCSLDQLLQVRAMLDMTIQEKAEQESLSQMTDSKYLN